MDIKKKIQKILHSIHVYYLKYRFTALAIFFAVVFVAISQSPKAMGTSLVAGVESKVRINFDNKQKEITTTQNTIAGAVKEAGIPLYKNDITNPPLDSLLNGQDQEIKVIRALPVLISDNNQEHLAYSAYTNEKDILKQLNIEIFPEDKISSDLIIDPADENAIGQKVTIVRAPTFIVHVDGTDQTIRSWGKTIGDVLANKITLGQRDIVEPSVTASSMASREITITRINYEEIDENVAIPFETVKQKDYGLYKGQTKVTQEGENGQKKQTLRIIYRNGLVVDKIILNSSVVKIPTNKIISEGAKPYNAGMWWDLLVSAGNTWGVDPTGLYNVMICESGGNPYSGTYYKGLFQYSPETWSGASSAYPGGTYRGAAITDGAAQISVTAWKVSKSGWSAWGCKP